MRLDDDMEAKTAWAQDLLNRVRLSWWSRILLNSSDPGNILNPLASRSTTGPFMPLDNLATAATSMGIIRLVIPIALDNNQASALLEPTPRPPLDDL